jgi:hypothetical protein
MTPLTTRQQRFAALGLALLMLATRGQHLAAVGFLPDASWAIFFLAGVYLGSSWAFWGFNALALALDVAVVGWGGVSAFCLSPAYVLLLPAHAALWAGGRWYAARHRDTWSTLLRLGGSLLVAAVAAELLASGGFYFFSGRFADTSLAGLGERLLTYFPSSLEALVLYVGLAALVHLGFALGAGAARRGGALGH